VVQPERSGRRYIASRDAGITGFSHSGLNSTDPARDERFWTLVCNASARRCCRRVRCTTGQSGTACRRTFSLWSGHSMCRQVAGLASGTIQAIKH
jgi:hypothetical protein